CGGATCALRSVAWTAGAYGSWCRQFQVLPMRVGVPAGATAGAAMIPAASRATKEGAFVLTARSSREPPRRHGALARGTRFKIRARRAGGCLRIGSAGLRRKRSGARLPPPRLRALDAALDRPHFRGE